MWFITIPDGGHVKSLNGDGNLPYHLALLFDEGRRIGEITFDQAEMKHIQMVIGVVIPGFTDLVNDGPIREGFQSLTWPLTNMIAGMCALASFGQSLVIDSSSTGRARDLQVRSQLRDSFASGPSRCGVCERNVENDAKVYATSDHMYVCYLCAAQPRFLRPDSWIEIELDPSTLPTDGSYVEFKTVESEIARKPYSLDGIFQQTEMFFTHRQELHMAREVTQWRYINEKD